MFHKNRAVVARFFWLQHTLDRVVQAADADLKVYLEQAGFCKIQSYKNKKGWLCVTAQK